MPSYLMGRGKYTGVHDRVAMTAVWHLQAHRSQAIRHLPFSFEGGLLQPELQVSRFFTQKGSEAHKTTLEKSQDASSAFHHDGFMAPQTNRQATDIIYDKSKKALGSPSIYGKNKQTPPESLGIQLNQPVLSSYAFDTTQEVNLRTCHTQHLLCNTTPTRAGKTSWAGATPAAIAAPTSARTPAHRPQRT